jgi:hypothetical protein
MDNCSSSEWNDERRYSDEQNAKHYFPDSILGCDLTDIILSLSQDLPGAKVEDVCSANGTRNELGQVGTIANHLTSATRAPDRILLLSWDRITIHFEGLCLTAGSCTARETVNESLHQTARIRNVDSDKFS